MFYSIQGEGRHMGIPTAFVRTTGCHLRCSWCDATYTFSGGEDRDLDEIFAWLEDQPTKHVCFTGGEPLLQKDAWDFVEGAVDRGCHVVIEPAGNLDVSRADRLSVGQREQVCISMDIKCPSSGEDDKNTPERMADLRAPDQLKFVIADRADYDYAVTLLRQHGLPPSGCPVYFNPVGGVEPGDITAWLLDEDVPLPVHVGVQLHKLVWGDVPGH